VATFSGSDSGRTITNTGTITLGGINVDGVTTTAWKVVGGTINLDTTSGKPTFKRLNSSLQDYLQISSVLTGTKGFDLDASSGRLYLSGSNTFTGEVKIIGGTVWAGHAAALNGNTVNILGSGAVLCLGGLSQTYTNNVIFGSTSLRFIFSDISTFTLSGTISESGGARTVAFTTDGADAVVRLQGNNTYTGDTQVGATHKWGSTVLRAEHNNALGTGTANVFFGGGTKDHDNDALELVNNVTIANKALTLRGQGHNDAGSLRSVSGTNTWSGGVNTGTFGNARIGVDADQLTISGVISGTAGLTKVGAGTLLLSADNTFTNGMTVNEGTLVAGHNDAVAAGDLALGDGTGTDTLRLSSGIALNVEDFSLTSSSRLAFDLNGSVGATKVVVTGNQTGTGTYTVDIFDGGGLANGTYTLMTVAGSAAATSFTLGTIPGAFSGSTLNWSSNTLTLTVVPEPSIGTLFGMGAGLTLLLRRRKKV